MWKLTNANLGALLLLIAMAFIVYKSLFAGEKWTLMVCKSNIGVECQENEYVIPGYQSQRECFEAGVAMDIGKGFECGKDCRQEYGLLICKPVCNTAGCTY